MRLAARFGQLLHRLALAIAAQEVHAREHASRVAPQDAVNQADRFNVLAPVDGGAQSQAGDGVGDRGLAGGLALVLNAHDVLGHGRARDQVRFERGPQRRAAGVVGAGAVQHLHQIGIVRVLGDLHRRLGGAGVNARDVRVGRAPRRAAGDNLRDQPAQVLDQRELEHDRPRPELADGQRRHALVAVEELRQLRHVEPAVAVTQQLDGNRVDARIAGLLARGQRRQLLVELPGQVLADPDDLG